MAEHVRVISAIGDIAADGYKFANSILPIVDELGTFRRQVRAIARDTKAVGNTLRQIKARLIKTNDVPPEIITTLAELVALCAEDIKNTSGALTHVLAKENRKRMLTHRLWWLLGKSKMAMRQASLDSLKLMLSLLEHTLDLMEDDTDTEDYVRDEVENMVANSRDIRVAFLEAEFLDRFMEREFEKHGNESAAARGPQNRDNISESSTEGRRASITSLELSAVEIALSISESGLTHEHIKVLAKRQIPSYIEGFPGTEFLASISEDHFLSIANHRRVGRLVSSLALGVARRKNSFNVTLQEGADSSRETKPRMESIPQISPRGSQPRASLSTTRSSISKARSKFGEETPGQSSSAQPSEPPGSNASHTSHAGTDDGSDTNSTADTMEQGSTDDHSIQAASRSSHDPASDFGIAYIYQGHTLWPPHGSSGRIAPPEKLPPGSSSHQDAQRTPPQGYGFSEMEVAKFRELLQAWERDRQAKDQQEARAQETASIQRKAKEQHEGHVEAVEETGRRGDERKQPEGKKQAKQQEGAENEAEEQQEAEEEEEPTAVDARKKNGKSPKKGLRKLFASRRSRPPSSKPMVLPYGSLTI